MVLPNPDGRWRPGLFFTVRLVRENVSVPVAVRTEAVRTFKDQSVVFVQRGDHFEVRPLDLGRRDGQYAEVVRGLASGEKYACANSFVLKAELTKAGASRGHSH